MLEQAYWKFAIRSVQIDPDGAITPAFGLQHAFNKPDDWISTYAVSANEYFDPPLQEWIEESNLWFSDVNPIYVRYVSNNATDYGADLSRWTSRFEQAFTLELAMRAAPKISGSNELKGELKDERNDELAKAKSFEALREPPRRAPEGAWVTAHHRGGPERLPGGWRF
ncbi:MAG: hypothetical protein ACREJC_11125 [Tepidisphaeraceae bacterium]